VIDRGLLATMVLTATVVAILDRLLRRRAGDGDSVLAMASTPLMVGLGVGRLVAVALDDPHALGRPLDLLLIRGGVEFWPGLVAACAWVLISTRGGYASAVQRLSLLAPFALWGYAAYEATCLLREGCFGPRVSAGLRPGGIGEPQLPVGAVLALWAVAVGFAVWRWSTELRPSGVVVVAVAGLAVGRAVAGFYLPRVSVGLTRAHRESIVVAAAFFLYGLVVLVLYVIKSRRYSTT
jgi:hypothetical protein